MSATSSTAEKLKEGRSVFVFCCFPSKINLKPSLLKSTLYKIKRLLHSPDLDKITSYISFTSLRTKPHKKQKALSSLHIKQSGRKRRIYTSTNTEKFYHPVPGFQPLHTHTHWTPPPLTLASNLTSAVICACLQWRNTGIYVLCFVVLNGKGRRTVGREKLEISLNFLVSSHLSLHPNADVSVKFQVTVSWTNTPN